MPTVISLSTQPAAVETSTPSFASSAAPSMSLASSLQPQSPSERQGPSEGPSRNEPPSINVGLIPKRPTIQPILNAEQPSSQPTVFVIAKAAVDLPGQIPGLTRQSYIIVWFAIGFFSLLSALCCAMYFMAICRSTCRKKPLED
jgi:hypothetical protein